MIKFFDAHSHLNFSQFDDDRDEIIARMAESQVWTITVGTNKKTSEESVALAEKYEHIFATVGVHPAGADEGFDEKEYEPFVKSNRVVAIGECGLDYYRKPRMGANDTQISADKQKKTFEKQIAFAQKHTLPLMIHARPSKGSMDAYEDVLAILKSHDLGLRTHNCPGNVHFFVGDTEVARQFLDLGFTISFDGPVTFTHEYNEVVQYVPSDRILAETDAPFAAPEPYRGKRNEPLYVKEVVRALARIRDEDEEELRETTLRNTCSVFAIPDTIKP